MKQILTLILIMSCTVVSACSDFSGLFTIQGSDPKLNLKIVQEECSSVEWTYIEVESGQEIKKKFTTNGQLQTGMLENEYIYFIHRGNYLEWNTINVETREVVQGKDHLSANGDIFTEVYRTDSEGNSSTGFAAFRRIRPQ